jgi:positive regulator of sigma E activity
VSQPVSRLFTMKAIGSCGSCASVAACGVQAVEISGGGCGSAYDAGGGSAVIAGIASMRGTV